MRPLYCETLNQHVNLLPTEQQFAYYVHTGHPRVCRWQTPFYHQDSTKTAIPIMSEWPIRKIINNLRETYSRTRTKV